MAHLRKHGSSFLDIESECEAAKQTLQQLFSADAPSISVRGRFRGTNFAKLTAWLNVLAVSLFVGMIALLAVAHQMLAVNLTVHAPGSGVHEAAMSPKHQFTVRMNTFRRNAELKKSVDHLSLCPAVAQIQIVWSDQHYKPPELSYFSPAARPLIVFEKHASDSLNNRFIALRQPATEAVFSVDDDMTFACEDLVFAFNTWRSAQRSMVGYVPRLVTWEPQLQRHRYRSWWYTWWNGAYNLVLTKACFLHRDYFAVYANLPPAVLKYIDEHRNCEDLAMSFVVAQESKASPIWVKGRLNEMADSGISSSSDHFEARSQCIDHFTKALGSFPLITSRLKVVPARDLWLWN